MQSLKYISLDTCAVLKSTVCIPCNCDTTGSSVTNCDENGICTCKDKFYGPKCRNRDCEVTIWSSWTACTRCGYTDPKTRKREVSVQPVGNGKKCPAALKETDKCMMIPCDCREKNPGYYGDRCEDRDCVWGQWSSWSSCQSCGGHCDRQSCQVYYPGKSRSRSKTITKEGNGRECSGKNWENDSCGYKCDYSCEMPFWGSAQSVQCNYYKA